MSRGKIWDLGSAYRADTRGVFAIKFALGSMLLLLSVGMAVDMSRVVNAKSQMQDAADMAVLLGATEHSAENRQWDKEGIQAFRDQSKNLPLNGMPNVSLEEKNDGTIVIEATGRLKPQFMQIFGYPKLEVRVDAAVGVGGPVSEKMEVVLVLDFSDSMTSNSKVDRLKSTVNLFLDDITDMQNNGVDVEVGLVPFAGMVYGTFERSAIVTTPLFPDNDGSGSTFTGCTGDRQNPANATLNSPVDDASKWGMSADGTDQYVIDKCVDHDYAANNLVIQPLTPNINSLRTELSAMVPTYNTHVALGLSMGSHMLSPGIPFAGAASFSDDTTKKVLILLTDGAQTRRAFGPGNTKSIEAGVNNLVSLCNELKSQNVTVSTIAYDLSGNASISGEELDNIQNCASDSSLSFMPDASLQSLKEAFEGIVAGLETNGTIAELRLIR